MILPDVNITVLAIGGAFVALGIYAFVAGAMISSILAIVIGGGMAGYALFIPSERQISKKVRKGMVGGFLELGKHKIGDETVKIDYEKFKSVVEQLTPVIAKLSVMPELGFDSIYLHYSQEHDAEAALDEIRGLSLDGSIVQNKGDWAVKIDLA